MPSRRRSCCLGRRSEQCDLSRPQKRRDPRRSARGSYALPRLGRSALKPRTVEAVQRALDAAGVDFTNGAPLSRSYRTSTSVRRPPAWDLLLRYGAMSKHDRMRKRSPKPDKGADFKSFSASSGEAP
jgi:hypothetical protein